MGCIEKSGREEVRLADFFVLGNKNWFKFFILEIITITPLLLMFKSNGYFYLAMFTTIIFYVKYSIVVDGGNLGRNLSRGISLLFDNLGLTIKMALYYGFLLSLVSFIVFPLSTSGSKGIIISIIIIDLLGVVFNKAALEVYRGIVNGEAEIKSIEDSID